MLWLHHPSKVDVWNLARDVNKASCSSSLCRTWCAGQAQAHMVPTAQQLLSHPIPFSAGKFQLFEQGVLSPGPTSLTA